MLLQYNILSQVAFRHDYFHNQRLNSLEWIPSKATERLAKNCGLIFKPAKDSLKILASTDADNNNQLSDWLREDFSLTFFISFNEPFWSNISEVSKPNNKCFYFTNIDKDATSSEVLLHQNELVTSEDLVEPVNQLIYALGTAESGEFKIVQGINGVDCSFAIKQIDNQYILDTKPLDEGIYNLTQGETLIKKLFISKQAGQFDAICHLAFSKDFGDTINADWTWGFKSFKVRFGTKATYWRYFLPYEKMEDLEGIQIINGIKDQVFNTGEKVAIQERDMIQFTSLSPIKLEEKRERGFQLRKNMGVRNKSEGVVISRLPEPEKTSLYRVDEQGNKYTEIYINL
ncbi:hypothetical protein [Roseivirga pacifica]|uniref:hypothetical protein n=1 Tax=Roseivirga pacifica TaxID=1267423 RepID=UPI003BA87DDE